MFDIVAAEVKALAGQTERATVEFGGEVARIREATSQAVAAIGGIEGRVHEINGVPPPSRPPLRSRVRPRARSCATWPRPQREPAR